MNKPLVILTGPTAVGKTSLSIQLAKTIGGEIISADSVQVYQYMDIGSAKITPSEMNGIPHYLVDVLEPDEPFHVAAFQRMAKAALAEIYAHGKTPIVVGGTGFYIQALLYDIDFTKTDHDESYRRELEDFARQHGADALHQRLYSIDQEAAGEIHANNIKRVIRALEFYQQTGTQISLHNKKEKQKKTPYNAAYFVLNDSRKALYQRIDQRVDQMVGGGLVEEVRGLKARGYGRDLVAMQGLGYKEIMMYLDGECTLEEAVYTIKRDTRHFAKRQLTWFKRERDVLWIDKSEYRYDEAAILNQILKMLAERDIFKCQK